MGGQSEEDWTERAKGPGTRGCAVRLCGKETATGARMRWFWWAVRRRAGVAWDEGPWERAGKGAGFCKRLGYNEENMSVFESVKLKQGDIWRGDLGTTCSDQSFAVNTEANQTVLLVRMTNNLNSKHRLCYHFIANINQLVWTALVKFQVIMPAPSVSWVFWFHSHD